jgi:hypothetical protein
MKERQDTSISLLTRSEYKKEAKVLEGVKKVYLFRKKGRFSILKIDIKLLYHLIRERFDGCISLCNNYYGDGYLNIKILSIATLAKKTYLFNNKGAFLPISRLSIFSELSSLPLRWLAHFFIWSLVLLLRVLKKGLFSK